MLRLQTEGAYPAAFPSISAPILLSQGEVDPHPGMKIPDSLAPDVRRLEYRELSQCGHYLDWNGGQGMALSDKYVVSFRHGRWRQLGPNARGEPSRRVDRRLERGCAGTGFSNT
jgi:pimeloyl-ACP methyl ester carboxylesterase